MIRPKSSVTKDCGYLLDKLSKNFPEDWLESDDFHSAKGEPEQLTEIAPEIEDRMINTITSRIFYAAHPELAQNATVYTESDS